jgi:exopolyphosphatase / guanosine-5'-triphosphate,3'-diphosphate pyrophosphatase
MSAERVAVLDVGSNSLRLLRCERIGPAGPEGPRETTIVGLRRGAAADGTLADAAIGRLERALAPLGERVRAFAPDRILAVCTSAVRDAPNGAAVTDAVRRLTGAEVHVLAGETEAALAFAGACLAVEGDRPILVIDVGGGSTELVSGRAGRRRAAVSLQLGAVRQTDRDITDDPPPRLELERIAARAREAASGAMSVVGRPGTAVAVAGTATTLAAVDLGRYDPALVHRHRLSAGRIDAMIERFSTLTTRQRERIPGLEPARAPVLPAGAAILAGVLRAGDYAEAMVSERDILDGIALWAVGRLGETFHS